MLKVTLKGNVLHIELPIDEQPKLSSTGKTLVVASTHGNVNTGIEIQGKALMVGVNGFIAK